MNKILITGGAGFVGSHLADRFIKNGDEVVVIDNLVSGKKEYINNSVKFYQEDIANMEVAEIVKKEAPDYIYHLAAQVDVRVSVQNPELDNKINVLGGLNILKSAHEAGARKVIFASTGGAIYGDTEKIPTTEDCETDPVSPYGIHKLSFEKYLNYYHQVYKQDYLILRFANIYGPRQYKGGEAGVISVFIDHAIQDKEITIYGDGRQTRDYVYVDDVVDSLVSARSAEYQGAINIGTAKEITLLDVVGLIEKALGRKIQKKFAQAKEGEQLRSCLDNHLAKKILSWEAKTDLQEGIGSTINWSKTQINK